MTATTLKLPQLNKAATCKVAVAALRYAYTLKHRVDDPIIKENVAKIFQAVENMENEFHRDIITKKYLSREKRTEVWLMVEMNITKTTLHRWKVKALIELAFALGIEVRV